MKYFAVILICCSLSAKLQAATVPLSPDKINQSMQPAKNDECRLDVGWTAWKPYQYLSPQNKLVGLQIELLTLIEKQMECQFVYHQNNWSNSVEAIKKGLLDFTGNASINRERKKFALFSDPYRQDLVVLYVRAEDKISYDNAKLLELFECHKFKIGMVKSSVYDGQLTELQNSPLYQKQFVYVEKSELLLDLLISGDIDGYFEDPLIFDHSIAEHIKGNLVSIYPLAIKIGAIHFMFSKARTSKETIAKFNRALSEVLKAHPEKFIWF